MADRALFDTRGPKVPATDATNVAGNPAYSLDKRAELAQLACTGTLGDAFYTSARDQLAELISSCEANDSDWIGRTAVYARKHGHMKDAPAVLMSHLAVTDPSEFELWAPAVIDNGRMVRNLVQMLRSQQFDGRKALPRAVRRYLRNWIHARRPRALLNDSVGTSPSMADVIKMVRPNPGESEVRRALYGYLLGKNYRSDAAPQIVRDLVAYKRWAHHAEVGDVGEAKIPPVDFRLLTGTSITNPKVWTEIALQANWHTLRMNLATFARHGVYSDDSVVKRLADKLRDPEVIRKVRVWPTQLWAAWKQLRVTEGIPRELMFAIQDALEVSVESVPMLEGGVIICPDSSGSMWSPLTGNRGRQSTTVTCAEMAGLFAFAVLKSNPNAEVLPFCDTLSRFTGNPRDSLVTLVEEYTKRCNGGGTHVALPVALANQQKWTQRTIWYVSDNAANMDGNVWNYRGTKLQTEFAHYRKRVPDARMIMHNVQPGATTQAIGPNVLNVGGFADTVFQVAADFARDGKGPDVWIDRISSIEPPQ